MSRPARSTTPLYYVRERGFSFRMRLVSPSNVAIDLRGSIVSARVREGSRFRSASITITDHVGGLFKVSSKAGDQVDFTGGEHPHELIISHTDPLGSIQDYVYPLVGEDL